MRRRIYYINETFLMQYLCAYNAEKVCIPVIEDLPEGAKLVSCFYDPIRCCQGAIVEHESFDDVPDGQPLPTMVTQGYKLVPNPVHVLNRVRTVINEYVSGARDGAGLLQTICSEVLTPTMIKDEDVWEMFVSPTMSWQTERRPDTHEAAAKISIPAPAKVSVVNDDPNRDVKRPPAVRDAIELPEVGIEDPCEDCGIERKVPGKSLCRQCLT